MKLKKWISLLAATVLMTGLFLPAEPSFAVTAEPVINGRSAILIDATTGEVLYDKASHTQEFPASTTKVMTAILAIENLKMDEVITVDSETPFTIGSRMYLIEGEQLPVKDVLYGMMTESANDAAVALGKQIAGSIDEFAKLMNEKMKEVGGTETNFVNPNGLHDDNHKTSAHDMALLARYAMQNESFREVVSTYKYIIPATNKQAEARYMYNSNRLLYDTKHKVVVNGVSRPCKYDGVTGIKTGYTGDAGGTLVASAKRGDTELIAVVMKSTDMGRFADCITMLDWGFENYKTVNNEKQNAALGEVKVKRGAENSVKAVLKEDTAVTVEASVSEGSVKEKVVLDESVIAPVKKGDVVGKVQLYSGKKLLKEVDAVAAADVEKGGLLSVFGIQDTTAKKLKISVGVAVAFFVAGLGGYIALKRRQERLRRQRRRARQERLKKKEEERLSALEQLRRENGFSSNRPGSPARNGLGSDRSDSRPRNGFGNSQSDYRPRNGLGSDRPDYRSKS